MGSANAEAERALREQARLEAANMFAHHGDAAGAMLNDRVYDPTLSVEERRRYRLVRMEIERLGREKQRAQSSNALVVWRPPLFSLAGIASLFGFGHKFGQRRIAKGTGRRRRR